MNEYTKQSWAVLMFLLLVWGALAALLFLGPAAAPAHGQDAPAQVRPGNDLRPVDPAARIAHLVVASLDHHLMAYVVPVPEPAEPQGNNGAWMTVAGMDGLAVVALKVAANGTLVTGADPGGPITQCGGTCIVVGGLSGLQSVALKVGSDGTVATSGGGINVLGTAGSFPEFGSEVFYMSGGTVYARNNNTGVIDASGPDLAAVASTVTTIYATTGAHFHFKVGVYPINSMTLESATGCSNFIGSGNALAYAIGFPANTPFSSSVQWTLEGEVPSVWQGESGTVVANTTGVIFNITAAAVASVAANSILSGVMPRPLTNCNIAATNVSNDFAYKNINIRFPTNTRGNEIAFNSFYGNTVRYENDIADFALPYTSIATGAAPVVGSYNSIGFTTTASSAGNFQDFVNTYAVGYNLGYDFQSEHTTGRTVTAIYNNSAGIFGRSGTGVFHPNYITHFVDQENLNGLQFGAQMLQGSRTDLIGLDIELGVANWYARTSGAMVETNSGFTSGIITYSTVTQGTGVTAEIPAGNLFTSGGGSFQAFEGTTPTNFVQSPVTDSFTRANTKNNNGLNGLGPAWLNGTQVGNSNLAIIGNAAVVNLSGAASGYTNYAARSFNTDQFSKATVNTIDSSASTAFEVLVNSSTSASVTTHYKYFCSHVAATGSGISRVVAGTSTTLASQTAVVGCNAGDVQELRHIGNGLWAYRNGLLDANFSPNPVIDSTITGGAPGLFLLNDVDQATSATNFSGGSLPTMHGSDSLYNNAMYATTYNTMTNCNLGNVVSPAACGSAASGTVVVPTTTATYTVNTTVVTTNSRIRITPITDNTGLTGAPTCVAPPTPFIGYQSARVAGTGFTFTLPSTTGASCWTYGIVN